MMIILRTNIDLKKYLHKLSKYDLDNYYDILEGNMIYELIERRNINIQIIEEMLMLS